MIGSTDTKLSYFDKGLIETLMPMIESSEVESCVRFEMLTVLNSFLFDCPQALSTLKLFHEQLASALQAAIEELSPLEP